MDKQRSNCFYWKPGGIIMVDFIEDLKEAIITAMPDVSQDWAEYCAIACLSTVLPNARIIEKEKPMSLNLIMLMIGLSGIKKSLPMTSFTYPIIKKSGELLNRDFILPSRSSVEGFIQHVSEEDENTDILKNNVGIIIRDEFSGLFRQARKTDWQSDGMEFVSEIYDGIFQKRRTMKVGLSQVENLYANLMSCSTYYFISQMDPEFFTQGTGNRFLYCHYELEEYKIRDIDDDYFHQKWGDERAKIIEKYAQKLGKLFNKNLRNIYVGPYAQDKWAKYKVDCESEWKKKATEDPLGWEFHPIKRYPELALKLAGLYAVSDFIDAIPRMSDKHLYSFGVQDKHMEKAINLVERNRFHFKQIVKIKNSYIPREKPKSIENKAKAMLQYLANAPDGILKTNDWLNKQDVTSNRNEKYELKLHCVARGWVEIIKYEEATKEMREKYDMKPRSELCKYIKGL